MRWISCRATSALNCYRSALGLRTPISSSTLWNSYMFILFVRSASFSTSWSYSIEVSSLLSSYFSRFSSSSISMSISAGFFFVLRSCFSLATSALLRQAHSTSPPTCAGSASGIAL